MNFTVGSKWRLRNGERFIVAENPRAGGHPVYPIYGFRGPCGKKMWVTGEGLFFGDGNIHDWDVMGPWDEADAPEYGRAYPLKPGEPLPPPVINPPGYEQRRERRERIATAAMQGLVVSGGYTNVPLMIRETMTITDALIAELDKP